MVEIKCGCYEAEVGKDVVIHGPHATAGDFHTWWTLPTKGHKKYFAKLLREIADHLEEE